MSNWNLLRALIAVQAEGGIVKASKKLGITQPALSAQLRLLEEQLGARLLERVGRQSQLTPMGRRAVVTGQRMNELYRDLQSEVRTLTSEKNETLSFAIEHDLDRPFLVRLINQVLDQLEAKPRSVRIQVEFEMPISEELKQNRIDFAFTSEGPEKIGYEPLTTVSLPVVLVGNRRWEAHFKGLQGTASEEKLFEIIARHSIPVLFPPPSVPLHRKTRDFVTEHGFLGLREIELWPLAAMNAGVAEGLGVAFLPKLFASPHLARKEYALLSKSSWDWGMRLYCYQPLEAARHEAAQVILDQLGNDNRRSISPPA